MIVVPERVVVSRAALRTRTLILENTRVPGEAAEADQGRWPIVLRIGVALAVGAAPTVVVTLVQRRRPRA